MIEFVFGRTCQELIEIRHKGTRKNRNPWWIRPFKSSFTYCYSKYSIQCLQGCGVFSHLLTKGQLISKVYSKPFICTKKPMKICLYFCPSLQNWTNQEKYMIKLVFQCFYLLFRPLFKGFLKLGQKQKNNFVGFWFK